MDNLQTIIRSEQAVIGCLLRDNDSFDEITELEASAFSREDHQIIYKSIVGFLHDGKPVDLILLAEFLDVQGNLDRVGGLPYISELVQCVNTTKNIKAHANSIASASKLRQVKTLLNLITNDSQLTLRALRALVEFSQPYTPALESYLSIDIFD